MLMSSMKRLFDLVMAALGLLALSPLLLWIAMRVRATSEGGAMFVQERVGRNERVFRCYKFRTMYTAAPNAGSHEVAASWVTPLGVRLRRRKLDELPQLWNVLRGDMSLVGPRPCLPSQPDVIRARRAADVFSVRPGITGSAQIAGIDMSTPEKLAAADRRYIDTQSFFTDLRIILATARGGGAGDAIKG